MVVHDPHRAASSTPCRPRTTSSRFAEPFTYLGYAGCLRGAGDDRSLVSTIALQVEGTERTVHNGGSPLTGNEVDDLKRLLAGITVAPSDDTATWFDLRTALGG